jgi:hypothetical protein
MRPYLTRYLAVALLGSTGCTAIRPVTREFVTADTPPVIWIERTAPPARSLVLTDPRVLGRDTLTGFVEGQYTELPFTQIGQMRARRPAPGRTVAFGVAIGAAAIGLGLLIKSGNGPHYVYEEPDFRWR